jgi:Fe-S-cluster containining protein
VSAPKAKPPDPEVCRRCAAAGPTCCTLSPGQEEFCFPLSLAEKERMQELLPDTGGFVLQDNGKAFVDSVARLFPGEEGLVRGIFPQHRQHFRLAVAANGDCRFLGPNGCLLPAEARPYYCRLYPFWITNERITCFDSPRCLARREARGPGEMIALLGTSAAAIRDLHGRLRLAWGFPPRPGMPAVSKRF